MDMNEKMAREIAQQLGIGGGAGVQRSPMRQPHVLKKLFSQTIPCDYSSSAVFNPSCKTLERLRFFRSASSASQAGMDTVFRTALTLR